MRGDWIGIPEAVADRHPLRPVRGWLILFGFWLVLPLTGLPFTVAADWDALADYPDLPAWAPPAWRAALVGAGAIHVALLILYVRRTRDFRLLFLPLALLGTVLTVLPDVLLVRATASPGVAAPGEDMAVATLIVLLTVAVDVLLTVAMWRGRRYRLVFERRVRADDPVLSPAGSLADAR